MSLADELRKREEALVRQLREIEARRGPIEEELNDVRKLLHRHDGERPDPIPYRGRYPNWAQMARDHGITTWTPQGKSGDSAHRTVRRHLADLHKSVPHDCIYDRRQYQ